MQDVWMELRPLQMPHQPMWCAGGPESTAKRAANFIANGSVDQITAVLKTCLAEWETARQYVEERGMTWMPFSGETCCTRRRRNRFGCSRRQVMPQLAEAVVE
jgi:hypothetical protein